MKKGFLCILLIFLLLLSTYDAALLKLTVVASDGGGASSAVLMGSGFAWPGPQGTQIDTWDGSLTLSRTEAELPSRVPIMIAFFYCSRLCNVSSQYGYGWRFNHNIYYAEDGNETIVVWGNGGAVGFEKNPDHSYTAPAGVSDTLEEYLPGKLVLTTKDDFKFYFDDASHKHVTRVGDRSGNMILFTYDRFGLLASIADDHSSFNVGLFYDDDGMLKRVQLPNRDLTFAYDDQQNLITIKTLDPTTFETVYESNYSYDALHCLTNISDPSNRTATIEYTGSRVARITSPLTETQITYDTVENKTTILERIDGIEQTTTFFFDGQGRCQKIQDTQGGLVLYEWDGNNIVSITDQKGAVTQYTYDSNRNPLVITDATGNTTSYTYRGGSNDLTSYTDARGNTWMYLYDAGGRLIQKTDPLGNNVTYYYNAYGDQAEIDYPNGIAVTFDYNDFGRVTRKAYSSGYYLNYSYDNAGNLIAVTDQLGNSIVYEYDLMNRIVSTTDRQGRKSEFFYDAYNNLIKRVDPGNRVTLLEYDQLDRVTKVVDALNQTTTYNYNASGHTKTFTDPRGYTTVFTYDNFNRIVNEQDALGNTASYTYDAGDNVLSFTDQNGNTTHYSYDALNRLTSVDYPGGNKAHYSYDQMGNVVQLSDSHATINYTYDALGRLTEVKDVTHNETVRYSYDANGNLERLTDPFGKNTTYTYDDQGRVTSVVDPASQTTTFDYTELGWLAQKHYPNGITAFYGYDNAGDLTYLMYQNSTGQTLLSYACEYDEAGNMIKTTDAGGNATLFGYDPLNRLVSVSYSNGSTTQYTYDACGNRIGLTSPAGTVNYVYDAANRLLQAGATTFEWNKNGNLVAKNSPSGRTTYQYDATNKLTAIGHADNTTTNCEYYPDGRLMKRTAGADQTCFIYSGQNVLCETDGQWNPTAEYNMIGIDDALSVKEGGNYYFYLYDYVGSVIGVTDNSEQVVSTCSYDAFGAPSVSGSFSNSLLFIGREYDPKSQLYNLRARYYDPFTGRFISRDPLPDYVAPYVYSSNNPLILSDPSGLVEEKTFESVADEVPGVDWPTSMKQKREMSGEELAQASLEDPNKVLGYFEYAVGKWQSGLTSEMNWLKKNWKRMLYAALGISDAGFGATELGVLTGVLGLRGNDAEPYYLCYEPTYRPGPGGLHLGINKRFWKSDWGFHVAVPEHVAETPFGRILTKILGPGKPIAESPHYFPLKGAVRAGEWAIAAAFLAAPLIGLKGCDRQKEPAIPFYPLGHVDVTDNWMFKMYERENPNPLSPEWWEETFWWGTMSLVENNGIVTGAAFETMLTLEHAPDGVFPYGPFDIYHDYINGTLTGNKLQICFNPIAPPQYYHGLTAYLNWYSTYGKGVTHIGWQFPFGVAENTSEIRVDTLVLINPVPDRIEPRYGPSADVTVILNDLKTGQPFSCGGPITFENLTPELATLSNYVDLGPQARIRISAIPSGEEKTKALGSTSSTWTLPSGEIKIKVKTPHLLEQNFTITVSPTSTWYVAADGSADFLTIQEAVDTAAPGDTIFVYSGKYNENVVIDKSITVDGEYNKPIIDGGGSGNTVTVLADNVTIKGCEITNSSGSYPDSGIFLDNVRNAVIDSNTIRDNLGRGIFVMWGSNNTITANEIFSNEKAGLRIDGTDANATVTWNYLHDNGEDGVFLYYARNVLIDNNEVDSNLLSGITPQGDSRNITITNNYLWLNHQNAIFTYASSNMTIENNNFNSNGQFGICLWASNNNRIISNEMTNDSLYVAESYGNTVEDNTVNAKPLVYLENATNRIVNDAGQVVLVNCTKITVKGLNLSNTDIGLELWQTSDSLIVDNLFQNNIWSIAAANSSGNTFYHNQFLGNSTEQVHIPSNAANTSNIWDNGYPSGGNYWSDYNGTDANHDGIGDTPYIIDANNVDHYPLMTSWAPTLTVENVVAWRWGGNTTVTCVAAGDVDGDGASEIVAGGYYFDGVRNVALLHVWNGSTLKVENSIPWFWGGDTEVTCIAVGDVDGDGKNEIVTGGYYYDGTRTVAQLHVWDGATLAVKKVQTWYWGGNTTINCLAIADVDGDGQMEIVTGGYYFDGVRNVALLHIWNGSTLAVKKVQSWDWGGDTTVNCLAIGDLYGNGQREIVTGGYYFDGVRRVAQLHIWNGTTLAVVGVQTWYWGGSTEINSVCIGDVDGDGASEIVTGGYYFDGTRNVALLHVWSASLSVERAVPWFWGGDTKALSVAVGDVDGDGKTEVVTGGYYFDGSEKVAQLHVWDGASLAVKDVKTWYWAGNTVVDSMVVSDVNNDLLYEIVTGGTFYYGSYDNAQLMEWSMM